MDPVKLKRIIVITFSSKGCTSCYTALARPWARTFALRWRFFLKPTNDIEYPWVFAGARQLLGDFA
jgi:hypothetical protein